MLNKRLLLAGMTSLKDVKKCALFSHRQKFKPRVLHTTHVTQRCEMVCWFHCLGSGHQRNAPQTLLRERQSFNHTEEGSCQRNLTGIHTPACTGMEPLGERRWQSWSCNLRKLPTAVRGLCGPLSQSAETQARERQGHTCTSYAGGMTASTSTQCWYWNS